VRVFDVGGFFLLLLFAFLITLVLTAIWPLTVSIDTTLQSLVKALFRKNREEEMELEDPKDSDVRPKSSCMSKFKYIWVFGGAIATCLMSGILSHLILLSIGLPTLLKVEQQGECYFVDTSNLGRIPSAASRRLRAGNNGTSTEPNFELPEDAPKAEAIVNSDGSVDFYMNCESSMYQASTGATWTIIPAYGVTCWDKEDATEVVNTKPHSQTKCTLGSWSPSVTWGKQAGFTDFVDFGEKDTGLSCGILKMGALTAYARGSYTLDSKKRWQECRLDQQDSYIFRIDENNNKQTIEFTAQLVVDPRVSRAYGWYTSGTEEIIKYAGMKTDGPVSIIFDKPKDWKEHMKKYFRYDQKQLVQLDTQKYLLQPSNFECRMMARVPNGKDFAEFQPACLNVSVSQTNTTEVENGNPTPAVKISTENMTMCTVTVGYEGTDRTTVVSVNKRSPITLIGAVSWRCETDGSVGRNCGPDVPLTKFEPEIVRGVAETILLEADLGTEGKQSAEINIKNPFDGLFDKSSIVDVIVAVVIAAVVLAVVVVGIIIAVKCIRSRRGSRETIVVAPQP
jgi:hypothetical protein